MNLIAINDSFFLECTIYELLRKHFRHLPYYTDIMDLFHDVCIRLKLLLLSLLWCKIVINLKLVYILVAYRDRLNKIF